MSDAFFFEFGLGKILHFHLYYLSRAMMATERLGSFQVDSFDRRIMNTVLYNIYLLTSVTFVKS